MRSWGVSDWETNYPKGARHERVNQTLEERTVILRYTKNNKEVVLRMGKQSRAVDNLRVLYLAVEAMRMNEKRGIGEIIESAYVQLAGPEKEKNPYEILGIREDAPLEVAEAVYKAKAMKVHPDSGGSMEQMEILNKAIEVIRGKL